MKDLGIIVGLGAAMLGAIAIAMAIVTWLPTA
jgi:hypothetical protein